MDLLNLTVDVEGESTESEMGRKRTVKKLRVEDGEKGAKKVRLFAK